MVGDQTKMREALQEILLVCYKAGARFGYDVACGLIKSKAKYALSSPPRNCDVGTAEEQFKRYLAFCHSESRGCEHCPANKTRLRGTSNCDLAWAQMPYEAQEGDGK